MHMEPGGVLIIILLFINKLLPNIFLYLGPIPFFIQVPTYLQAGIYISK